jgi:hypothetical protein
MLRGRHGLLLWTLLAPCLLLMAGCSPGGHPVHAEPPTGTSRTPAASAVPTARAHAPAPVSFIVQATVARYRLPAPVFRTMAAAADGAVFVLGGLNTAGVTIGDVVRITPGTHTVTRVGTLAEATHGAAAVTAGGRIVIFGGAATTVHTVVQSFDPSTGITTVIGSLAGPRADLAAATAGGRLVLLGGFDGSGPLSSVLIGSGATRFRTLTRLPQAVRYPAVAVSGGDVYLFGGLLAGGEYTGTFTPLIQQVDPATGTTRIAGRLPYPVAHAKAVVLRGQILILGGSTPRGPTSDILRFDPARRGVTRVGRLPVPSTDGAVAAVGDTGYLAGGLSATGPLDQIVVIKLRSTTPARSAG